MVDMYFPPWLSLQWLLNGDEEDSAVNRALCITVWSVAGERLDLKVDEMTRCLDVKRHVAFAWRIPEACQQLLYCGRAVANSTPLHQLDGTHIEFTMVVSTEEVLQDLQCTRFSTRKKAVETLAKLGPRCGDTLVAAVGERLEDEAHSVRLGAANALPKVAKKGDPAVMAAVTSRLGHQESDVRWAAVQAIAFVSNQGDPEVRDALLAVLKDRSWVVR